MGRRLVVGDIHGCIDTFNALLDSVALSKDDNIFLLGDYIDKGVDSGAVIDKIIELKAHGYIIHAIRGNHEENLIYAHENYSSKMLRTFVGRISKSWTLLDEGGKIYDRYLEFVYSLPDYYDTGDFLLVHTGLNFNSDNPLSDRLVMIGERRYSDRIDISKIGMRRVVHGHRPTHISRIKNYIRTNSEILPLDAGCVYTRPKKGFDVSELGFLCCLDLDSNELVIQKNIDKN